MNQIAWLHAGSNLMLFAFLFGSLIYAVTRRGDHTSAKSLAVAGLAILVGLQIVGVIATYVMAQYLPSNTFGLYHGCYSAVSNLIHMLGLGFLVAAAFSGSRERPADDAVTDDRYPVQSDNPYTPPIR